MRDRFALALAGAATATLVILSWVALDGGRPLDMVVLALTALVQVIVVILWIAFPRLPRWMVLGYGLIAIAMTIGFALTAPPAPTGAASPAWGLVGLLSTGVMMILASLFHRSPAQD